MKRRDKATADRFGAMQVEVTLELRRGRRVLRADPGPRVQPALIGHIPRITRLMALAIKFQEMVDRSEVRDYADIARLGCVTRARLTQIMNLLNLAPDIQEQLLFLAERTQGREIIAERNLRPLTHIVSWDHQRKRWRNPPKASNPVVAMPADGMTLTPTE